MSLYLDYNDKFGRIHCPLCQQGYDVGDSDWHEDQSDNCDVELDCLECGEPLIVSKRTTVEFSVQLKNRRIEV